MKTTPLEQRLRQLAGAYLLDRDPLALLASADALEESGVPCTEVRILLDHLGDPSGDTKEQNVEMYVWVGLLPWCGKVGRRTLSNHLKREVKEAAKLVWKERDSRRVHPQGSFDSRNWTPDEEEEAGDCCGKVRRPSRKWPWSYMLRCRTKEHCTHLCWRGLLGYPVPRDVQDVGLALRSIAFDSFGLSTVSPVPLEALK